MEWGKDAGGKMEMDGDWEGKMAGKDGGGSGPDRVPTVDSVTFTI